MNSLSVKYINIIMIKLTKYLSALEFKSIHKVFGVTISTMKYAIDTKSDVLTPHVYNNISFPLGFLTNF